MKKFLPKVGLLIFAVMLLFSNSITAQPPCLPVGGGIPAGNDAPGCSLCGPIYQGSTSGYGPSAPGSAGFPCGTIENNQFISIIADATGNINALVLATNCQNNQGVQLVIFDQSFNPVSNCFTAAGLNVPGNVTASGLTPGQQYWIMIDGFAGDICDILLTVSGGVSTGPPDPPGPITINPDVSPLCPGAVVCYSIGDVNGASEYEWNIPGNAVVSSGCGPNDTQCCIEFTAPGGGVVIVTPTNPCFPGIPAITPIIVLPILPTFLDPEEVCVDAFPVMLNGISVTGAGLQEIIYQNDLGCDSVVSFLVTPVVAIPNQIDSTICEGDCVMIGNNCYDLEGTEKITLQAPNTTSKGCDSIVILTITKLNPVADIAIPDSIGCNPGDSVILDGSGSSTGANFTYSWTTSNGGVLNGANNVPYTSAQSPGTYTLTVSETGDNGLVCIARQTVEVFQEILAINTPIFNQPNTNVCTDVIETYSVTPVSGANVNGYEWFLPAGAVIVGANNGNSIQINFTDATSGAGEICVIAHGDCGDSPRSCIPINVNETPNSEFTATPIICEENAATIVYTGNGSLFATYTWNFNGGTPASVTGAGPHDISWDAPGDKTVTLLVKDGICEGDSETHIVQVDPALDAPVISCTSTQTSVTFSWNDVPNADEYLISVNGAPATPQTGTTITINDLTPGDAVNITVSASGTTACPPSSADGNCVAQNCDDVNLNITPVSDICRDAATGIIRLTANPTGGAGGGTFIWRGTGTSPDGTFNPLAANIGINTIALEYSEGTCTYTETIEIFVNNIPDASFTVTTPVCEGEIMTLTYTGSASPDAVFEWDFGQGNGQIVSGDGTGRVEVICPPGVEDITLIVIENGCMSEPVTQIAITEELLDAPIINCISSTSEKVVMGWGEVPGATGYIVNALDGVVDLNNRTVTFCDLSPGDEVTIEVITEGSTACPASRSVETCKATDCPALPIDITQIGPFCDDGKNDLETLSATAGDNTGNFTWSGPGIVQPDQFDPNSAAVNAGILTVRVSYQKDNCTWSSSLDIEILKQPTADFEMERMICVTDFATVNYTGDTDVSNAIFNWNFQNGNNPNNTSGAGAHKINWDDSGIQTISLTVEENGCISEPVSVDIQVDDELAPPVISCDADQNSIDFSWLQSPGVLNYTAEVTGGNVSNPTGTPTILDYNFTGLNPGDIIEITVTAEGNTECGPVSSTLECIAQDCPEYNLIMPVVKPICTYGREFPFQLTDSMEITNLLGESLMDSVNLLWHDGSNDNTYVTPGGQFFTASAASTFGVGDVPISVEIEYPKGSGCFKIYNSTIRLNPIPDNDILLAPQICVTETTQVILSQAVSDLDATFDWNFGNAQNLDGELGGPYTLQWTDGKISDSITVQVTEFGCVSDLQMAVIQIDEELSALDANLRCNVDNTTNSFIEFNWDDVPNATDYDITVLTSTAPTPDIRSNIVTFDGLSPRDIVEVELTVSNTNSACPPVSIIKECIAIACPPTSVEIQPISDNCLPITGNASIQLTSDLFDDPTNGSGNLTYTGDMVSANGLFTPDREGNYTIAVVYSENGCSYNSTLDIQMWATPIADFEVTPIICVTDEAVINFTGDAPSDAVFNWDFDGALGANADDANPTPITWNASDIGIQNIVLNLDNHGCLSAPASREVQVDPELEPLNIICGTSTTTSIGFSWSSDVNVGNYDVSIKIDGGNFMPEGIQNNTDFTLFNLVPDAQSLVEIEVIATGDTECGPITERKVCIMMPCPDISVIIEPIPPVCLNAGLQVLSYSYDISLGGLGNGTFDFGGPGMNLGLFNPEEAGVGTHTIFVSYEEQGCMYDNTVQVVVNDFPEVDAGGMMALSCFELEVEIGSEDADSNLDYSWIFDGNQIGTTSNIFVDMGGDYTLEATDPVTGCSATDMVFVDANFTEPNILAELTQITCFGRNDGIITIKGMENGTAPYRFSFNGEPYSDRLTFTNLGSGSYTIIGRDANGCEDEITFEILEPDNLTVEIIIIDGDNPVPFGDSIHLEAVTNYAPDLLASVNWSPVESFPICDETNITNCLSHWVSPTGQTVYSVRVENLNGCAAEDVISIIGEKKHPVYIPSGFSPNDNNGENDIFGIFGNPEVVRNIKTFKIFDRWGEQVYENFNFPPIALAGAEAVIPSDMGWDGTHRGKRLNTGVFVYLVEAEFFDGTTQILKGDVTIK